jgi:ubiquinone biosynthesis protein Coq4
LSEKFISNYTRDDLLACPPGSLGAAFAKYVVENNFELDIIARFEPKTQYDYYRIRSAQTHDLEHIVGGGGFDILGELVPYYIRLTNIFKFLPAELAGEVSVLQVFGSMRILARTAVHYPQSWLAALGSVQRGIRVGLESGPLFMAKYEDALHLPIPRARELLGVVGAVDVDTRTASHEWDEYK